MTADSLNSSHSYDTRLLSVDLMDGHDFECWTADFLREIGFSSVEVTPASGDHGVDIIAIKDGIKYAVQCKRYTSDLGNGPVQEVHAGKYMYQCHVGAVFTNRYFTAGAKKLAEATGTLLWDRDWIISHFPESLPSITTPVNEDCKTGLAYAIVHQRVSISELCSKFSFSYERASNVMDFLHQNGYIGDIVSGEASCVYATQDDWIKFQASLHPSPPAIHHATCIDVDESLIQSSINVLLETGQASVSILERKLHLDYIEAAHIMTILEERKIVSPFDGTTPRKILIKSSISNLPVDNHTKKHHSILQKIKNQFVK